MKQNIWRLAMIVALAGLAGTVLAQSREGRPATPGAKQFRYSTTVEKERPQLNEETKRLIAAYRREPTKANWEALRVQVAKNYDAVLARKKAKLEELKRTARHASKVQEMQEIVDEMIRDRDSRIEQSMRRFTDARLRPGSREAKDGFLPVLGAAQNVNIAYTPVTNAEYAKFVKATGRKAPKGWKDGKCPAGKDRHPVVNVSYQDAVAYCQWRSKVEGRTCRLPTEQEWEYAAGHMPKDADFNCGENNGTTPVDRYAKTLAACGAIDMWGNVWEWTGTKLQGKNAHAVKGGAWNSARTSCRTESRGEGRDPAQGYDNVGFRVVMMR